MSVDSALDAHADVRLANDVEEVVRVAGELLLALHSGRSRPGDRAQMLAGLRRNEQVAQEQLREGLSALRPEAGWAPSEQESATLPDGECWVVDAVEGNVNHVHGLSEWCVSVTLLRERVPVLTVVRVPIEDATYTAVRGAGAFLDGRPLRVSEKTDLGVAIAATGQAEAGQRGTYYRIGASITAMLHRVLLVRASVPSTFPLLQIADGHCDLFWQYEPALVGVAAGILLVTEAGGVVSRIDGSPWQPGSPDILVTTPVLHAAAVETLAALA